MSSREITELRRALERLRTALIDAVRALEDADSSPHESAEYRSFGAPFGDGRRARELWKTYGQYSTRN